MNTRSESDPAVVVKLLYVQYYAALRELGAINQKRDFSANGEQEYLEAQQKVKTIYNDLYYLEQRYLWGKSALR